MIWSWALGLPLVIKMIKLCLKKKSYHVGHFTSQTLIFKILFHTFFHNELPSRLLRHECSGNRFPFSRVETKQIPPLPRWTPLSTLWDGKRKANLVSFELCVCSDIVTYLNFYCGVCLLISTFLRFFYIRKCNNENRISVKNTLLSWYELSCRFSRLCVTV